MEHMRFTLARQMEIRCCRRLISSQHRHKSSDRPCSSTPSIPTMDLSMTSSVTRPSLAPQRKLPTWVPSAVLCSKTNVVELPSPMLPRALSPSLPSWSHWALPSTMNPIAVLVCVSLMLLSMTLCLRTTWMSLLPLAMPAFWVTPSPSPSRLTRLVRSPCCLCRQWRML